jgi:hypothetical protein
MPLKRVAGRIISQATETVFIIRKSGKMIKTEYSSVKREGKTSLLYSTFFGCLFVEKLMIEYLPLRASFWNLFGIGKQFVPNKSIYFGFYFKFIANNPSHLTPYFAFLGLWGYTISVQQPF